MGCEAALLIIQCPSGTSCKWNRQGKLTLLMVTQWSLTSLPFQCGAARSGRRDGAVRKRTSCAMDRDPSWPRPPLYVKVN